MKPNSSISNPIDRAPMLGDWLEIMRPFSWTASLIPVVLGGVLASQRDLFQMWVFLPVLLGVILLQGAANMVNEYYDLINGNDTIDDLKRPSRVLVEGRINPALVLSVGKLLIGLFLVMAFAYTLVLRQLGIPIFALLAVSGAYYYTAPPLDLKSRGLGTISVFLLFGLVLTSAVYYTLTNHLALEIVWVSLPVAFLVSAILYGNDLRDVESDKHIPTIARTLGSPRAEYLYTILIGTPYLLAAIGVVASITSPWALLPVVTLPMAITLAVNTLKGDRAKIITLDVNTAKLHLLFGILWIIGLVL